VTTPKRNNRCPAKKGIAAMPPIVSCNLAALAIAVIYYAWRDLYCRWRRDTRALRERVAYMLWIAAGR
jgi:hypothetical protein